MTGVFFDGREIITPSVQTAVNDTGLQNDQLTATDVVAIVGSCAGGTPKTGLRFTNPADAMKTLVSGDLAEAVVAAFSPSPDTGGPSEVWAVRVDPATQATLPLQDATPNTSIMLTSVQYGAIANTISVELQPASGTLAVSYPNPGAYLAAVRINAKTYTRDNVGMAACWVGYSGIGLTPTVAVTAVVSFSPLPSTKIITLSAGGITVATIPLSTLVTVADLVGAINAVADFSATAILPGSSPLPTLDMLAAAALTTPVYLYANTAALVDYFNSLTDSIGNPILTAVQQWGGDAPAMIASTPLAGGSVPAAMNSDWQDAFTALQQVDCQWIAPLAAPASSGSVFLLAQAHVEYMSTVAQGERRAIIGGIPNIIPIAGGGLQPTGVKAQVLTMAQVLNSDRVGYAAPSCYRYNLAGKLVKFPGWMVATLIASGFAALGPGESMTNKRLNIVGLDFVFYSPGDTDVLIRGGVIPVVKNKRGFVVSDAVSTWQGPGAYDKTQLSVGDALDYVARQVRAIEEPEVGARGGPMGIQHAVSRADTVLRELSVPPPTGPGVLVGDAASPPFRNVKGVANGTAVNISFECSPVEPMSYILVTINATSYDGTVRVPGPGAASLGRLLG